MKIFWSPLFLVLVIVALGGCAPSEGSSTPQIKEYSKSELAKYSKSELEISEEGLVKLECERSLIGHDAKAHLIIGRVRNFGNSICGGEAVSIDTEIGMTTRSQGRDTMLFSSSFSCKDKKEPEVAVSATKICSEIFTTDGLYKIVAR